MLSRSELQPLVTLVIISDILWLLQLLTEHSPVSHVFTGEMMEVLDAFDAINCASARGFRQLASDDTARMASVVEHCDERDCAEMRPAPARSTAERKNMMGY